MKKETVVNAIKMAGGLGGTIYVAYGFTRMGPLA